MRTDFAKVSRCQFFHPSPLSHHLKMSCSDTTSPFSKLSGIINLISSFDLRSKCLLSTIRFSPLTIKATASTNNRSLPKIDILVLMAAPFLSVNRKRIKRRFGATYGLTAGNFLALSSHNQGCCFFRYSGGYSNFKRIFILYGNIGSYNATGKTTSFTDFTSVPTTVRLIPSITIEG